MHVPTLANAAAAALGAGAFARCVALCDSALRIADAGVTSGALCAVRVRIKLLLRRATAKCELGHWKGAQTDLRRASAFAPSDLTISAQLRAVCDAARKHGVELEDSRSAIAFTHGPSIHASELPTGAPAAEASPYPLPLLGGESAVNLKTRADQAFMSGALESAVSLYTDALAADSLREWSALTAPGTPDAADAVAAAAAAPAGETYGTITGTAETDTHLDALLRPPAAVTGGVQFRCQCLSNRAACLLKLGDFSRAIDDCTAAMAAVRTGLSEQGEAERARSETLLLKLLLRRAAAYVELSRFEDALGEYEEAHKLAPDNAGVSDALSQLRARGGQAGQ
mmetsp:Transcript_36571/g.85812  ORF Transcript_36571/g.85812 Transcript_36571/m.85812 type:complete len:341 (+) Transcript_36571:471-1493(+)